MSAYLSFDALDLTDAYLGLQGSSAGCYARQELFNPTARPRHPVLLLPVPPIHVAAVFSFRHHPAWVALPPLRHAERYTAIFLQGSQVCVWTATWAPSGVDRWCKSLAGKAKAGRGALVCNRFAHESYHQRLHESTTGSARRDSARVSGDAPYAQQSMTVLWRQELQPTPPARQLQSTL